MFWRLVLFTIVLFCGATGTLALFAGVAIVYAFAYAGLELIIAAWLVDSFFRYGLATVDTIPLFTITAAVLVLLVVLLRPYLSLYNR